MARSKKPWHTLDMHATVVLGRQGRLVIPADVRRSLNLNEGDRLTLTVTDNTLTLAREQSRAEAVDALRGALSGVRPERSLVDELIAERRAEATRE